MFKNKVFLVYRAPVNGPMLDIQSRCDAALKANGHSLSYNGLHGWLTRNVGAQARPGATKRERREAKWHIGQSVADRRDRDGRIEREWTVTVSLRDEADREALEKFLG